MQRTKDMIRAELNNLETNERDIEQFTGDPKENITGGGLHPYDWTDRVRRVWRGNLLFS